MHTLVIQLGRLGDVIQTTALLRDLAAGGPGHRVDVLLLHPNQSAILGMEGLASVRTVGEELKPLDDQIAAGFAQRRIPMEAAQLLKELDLPRYDRVINASHAALGCWLAAEISADRREGGVITREGECLYEGAAQTYRVAMVGFREQNWFNIVDLMRCAAPGGERTTKASRPRVDAEAQSAAPGAISRESSMYMNSSALLPFALPPGRKVALNVGASEKERQWPAEHFARLVEGLIAQGFSPMLVGAPSDIDVCAQVQASSRTVVPSFAGKTSIQEMALLLAQSELLVSSDTGAAHIAAAVGTKVVGLFGASAYFSETAPWGKGHSILQTRLGARMSALHPDSVFAALLHRLGRLDALALQHELALHGQAAWETDFLPSSSDPLGGLCYRPLHLQPLTAGDVFTLAMRHVFAREFCGGRGSVSLNYLADALSDSSDGVECGVAVSHTSEVGRNADSLAHILEQMQKAAAACAEMTGRHDAGIGAISAKLMHGLDGLKSLTERDEWSMFRPVVHYLDWSLRMMPPLAPTETFLLCAKEYRTTASLLRQANALVSNFVERDQSRGAVLFDGEQRGCVPIPSRVPISAAISNRV